MYKNLIWNDIKSSKLISITVLIFIIFNSFLLSTSGIILVNLTSSINHLMEASKTPHYLQMHIGDFNPARMENFALNNDKVLDYHVQGFLNVDSNDIFINEKRLANNSQDNGFVYQNKNFDFLLTLDGEIAKPNPGEVYIPITYFLNEEINTGDKLSINGNEFTVVGPIRDSQMNSTLSSSKRFLINEKDYDKLQPFGNKEYLIEFLLKDVNTITEFEDDYAKANLESNGPTITHTLFKLINAISDGIMIAILFLISFLILAISFLCIRFTLVSKIEDEYREIGVMKAIGIRNSQIKKMYLGKYFAIALFGVILGFVFALFSKDSFLEPIRLNMGNIGNDGQGVILGLILSSLVFVVIIAYVNRVLNAFKKMTPSQALKREVANTENYGGQNFKLQNQSFINSDIFLGVKRVVSKKKLYVTFTVILILSTFIMILPKNIYSTINSKSFVPYMGVGESDMIITLQEGSSLINTTNKLQDTLNSDDDVFEFSIKYGKKYEMKLDNGGSGRLQVVLGDQSKFEPKYVKGEYPSLEDEISISYLSSEELGKDLGDRIVLIVDGKEKELKITGVYSDITNGGKTAHATFEDYNTESLWVSIPVIFDRGVDIKEKVKYYELAFENAKIIGIEDYIDQVFGSTIKSINSVSRIGILLAMALVLLNTTLFVKMLVSKERRDIDILKAIGFSSKKIKFQYNIGSILLLALGIVFGTILASTLGQTFASKLMSIFGVANIKFSLDYVFVFIITPLTLAFFVFIATSFGVSDIDKMRISNYIKE